MGSIVARLVLLQERLSHRLPNLVVTVNEAIARNSCSTRR